MNRSWWVIIGLAAVIVLMILFDRDPEPNTQPWKDTIAQKEVEIQSLAKQNQSLLNKLKEDSIREASERSSFLGQINGLKSRLAKQRVKIDTVILENPEVARYVELADSTIQAQEIRIDTLESNLSGLRVDLGKLTANFQEQIKLHEQKFAASQEMNQELEKDLKKKKRGIKWLKAGAVAGTIAGFVLGSNL